MISPRHQDFAELVGFPGSLPPAQATEVHGTTVLAIRHSEGALVFSDRRATMGNLIMYEHAEKIEMLDPTTVVAISGAYARSIEVCRFLRHSFKFYERLNLQTISTEGKLMEISRALAGNIQMAMSGIGVFLPIAAAYDPKQDTFGVYFFDTAGARFRDADYACAGSGSERIRGVFEYLIRTKGAWPTRSRDEVLQEGLRLLDIAASLDSATGGFRRAMPLVCELTRHGAVMLPETDVAESARAVFSEWGQFPA